METPVDDSDGHLYLDLMKKVLTNVIYQDGALTPDGPTAYRAEKRHGGLDWPAAAHTMIGLERLDNLHDCLERVLADGIDGDLVETGVWRGGACIFMRAFLKAHGVADRRVWVADSFTGIPDVGIDGHPLDRELALHQANGVLDVPQEEVAENFRRYGLLDEQVVFLPGRFRDSLPQAPIEKLALLRLDGDLYESTRDALTHLYPRLSTGGFVIVDDYVIPACRAAVHDFRHEQRIDDPIQPIDVCGAYWRRSL